jgi:uncharacterized protein involved in exopolysaccharide biosynthesis
MSRIDEALKRLNGTLPGTPQPTAGASHSVKPEAPTPKVRDDRRTAAPGPSPIRPAAKPTPVSEVPLPKAEPAPKIDTDRKPNPVIDHVALHYVAFAFRSLRRHKLLVTVVMVLTFGLTLVGLFYAPPRYEVGVKLLAQRNSMMASISNPGRSIPYDADAPTRAAAETILRRDNLLSLIRETNLLNEWDQQRAPILRLLDRIKAKMSGRELTLDDKLDDLVNQIERHMIVTTSPTADGLVTIELTWPDAHSGYLLVERARAAFVEARQAAETQAISEAVGILERYRDSLNHDVQVTLTELMKLEPRGVASGRTTSPVARIVNAALPPVDAFDANPLGHVDVDPSRLANPRLGRLKNAAAAKKNELARLEEEQKRKLADIQAQLAVARTIYTPNHPTVMALQQSITTFSQTPQIAYLRAEVERLEDESDEQAAADAELLIRAELARRGSSPARPRRVAPVAGTPPPAPSTSAPPESVPEPPKETKFATLRLRTELGQLQAILDRTNNARIELAVSQAAYKFRYTIIEPAEEPGDPTFPDKKRVLAVGFLTSLVLAMIVGIAADALSGRIIETWQVQHRLALRVLGVVRLP